MSLNHLLLGFTRNGITGSAIKLAFQGNLQHIWDAELSQIYPALQRLEKQGLLTSRTAAGEHGRSRVYTLTASGEKSLLEWLRSDPILHDERHPFLVQLCLLGDVGDYEETLRYFRCLKVSLETRLHTFEQLEEQWQRHDPVYPDVTNHGELHAQMTLAFGLSNARASLQTCEECMTRIQRRLEENKPGSRHEQ